MQLIRYEAARQALAECKAVDEVKDIRDKALAMAAYARQAKDTELMQNAAEIKVRAERALGEMIRQQKETQGLNEGGRPQKTGSVAEPVLPTLSDVGIDRKLSMRSQQLAAMSESQFESTIATARETASAVTTTMMLRVAEESKKNADLREDIERLRRNNYLKHAATALDEALYWLRVGEETDQETYDDQAIDVMRKVDQINQLAERLKGKQHANA